MSFVWKRLQRVNKRAVKYRILFELHELIVEGCSKWQPNKLVVVFTRRSRRRCSQPMIWEPTIRNPYLGSVQWTLPEIIDIEVTLFKDSHGRFESKDWTISIEDISPMGKQRRIASAPINISEFIDEDQFAVPSRHEFSKKKLQITSKKVRRSYISFTMATQFLKEGKATDDDMQSLASLISMNGPDPTPDLDDDDQNPQLFKYSDQTQNEISEMIEQFNNQFLNTDDNLVENVGDQHEQRQNFPTDKREIVQNVKPSCHVQDFTIEALPHEQKLYTPPPTRRHNHQTDSSIAKCKKNFESSAANSFVTHSRLEREPCDKPDTIQIASLVSDQGSQDKASLPTSFEPQHHTDESGRNALPSSYLIGGDVHDHDNQNDVRIVESECFSSVVDEQHSDSNFLANDDADEEHFSYIKLNQNSFERSIEEKFDDSAQSISNQESSFSHSMMRRLQQQQKQEKFEQQQQSGFSTAEDLLSWCQMITKDYGGVMVTNMTTSWRNGLAFGAIIHHFRPDLIDFDSLQPSDIVGNCKKVFDAASKLGIPKLIDPNDMIVLNVPDKLSVMTYLYQLRSYFTGKSMIGSATTISDSYSTIAEDEALLTDDDQNNRSIDNVKAKCLTLFNRFDGLDNSTMKLNQKQYWQQQQLHTTTNVKPTGLSKNDCKQLMTRKQLMNPFESDSEEEEIEIMNRTPSNREQSSRADSTNECSNVAQHDETSEQHGNRQGQPIRKPLQYRKPFSTMMPASQSTLSFNNYRSISINDDDDHTEKLSPNNHAPITLSFNNHHVNVVPGLIDLSSHQHQKHLLQRTFSAPNCQHPYNHSIEALTRKRTRMREEELRDRARKLIESIRFHSTSSQQSARKLSQTSQPDDERRMEQLRERARRLIANARQGMMDATSLESSLSSSTNSTNNATPQMMSPSESISTTLHGNEQPSSSSLNVTEELSRNPDQSVKLLEFNFYTFKTCETKNTPTKTRPDSQQSGQQKSTRQTMSTPITKTAKKSDDYNDFPNYLILYSIF
nr:EH domain-binding protein 1-like isoform X2 [Dermatophagoides farinae]